MKTVIDLDEDLLDRARDIHLALTQRGHHRAANATDLIAAAAAAEYGAIVLHSDRGFDLIADAGGPRSEWNYRPARNGLYENRAAARPYGR